MDNRVHCCFYFISPYGHGLKPLDIDFMKQLSNKVSIVPVIAKSDCLTMSEIKRLKTRILEEIGAAGIRIYSLPDVDTDEDEEYKQQVAQLRESIPFAVCGANAMVEVGGRKVGPLQSWGPMYAAVWCAGAGQAVSLGHRRRGEPGALRLYKAAIYAGNPRAQYQCHRLSLMLGQKMEFRNSK